MYGMGFFIQSPLISASKKVMEIHPGFLVKRKTVNISLQGSVLEIFNQGNSDEMLSDSTGFHWVKSSRPQNYLCWKVLFHS